MTTKLRKDRPGYQYRRRSDGSVAHYWSPKRASRKAPPGLPVRSIADDASDATIAELCRAWTDELLADLEVCEASPSFNGTLSSLITLYRTDAESPYHALKHSTRIRDYEPALRLIDRTVGKRRISELRGEDFRRWYKEWGSKGRVRRAHGAIRKLRTVFSYGVTQKHAHCAAAREILSLIEFDAPATRKIKMEYQHARAIVLKAMRLKAYSIAFTQAMQWDCALRRIHVIGEWLPVQPGEGGGIVRGGTKWQGPTAASVSADLIFTPANVSKNKAASSHDLRVCPLVQRVLRRFTLPKVGPLVLCESTGLPWRENYYATAWREIAKAAGVPENVWSMDARAGAISEAEEVAGLGAAQKLAAHSNPKTTLGYVRNDDLDSNRKVAQARAERRRN